MSRQLQTYKTYILQLATQNVDPTDYQHPEDLALIERARSASSFEDLFEVMGLGGWTQTDVDDHIEEFESEGNSSLADALRWARNSSIRPGGAYTEMPV